MTEEEWLDCDERNVSIRINSMFEYIQDSFSLTSARRKIAQIVAGWGKQIGRLVHDDSTIRSFRLLDRGLETDVLQHTGMTEFQAASEGVDDRALAQDAFYSRRAVPVWILQTLWPVHTSPSPATLGSFISFGLASMIARADQILIIRDVIGNPFRPVTVEPSWVTSTVLELATGIYNEKAFDRMPILADALQDAGCDNEDILNHCRQRGEHVRGC